MASWSKSKKRSEFSPPDTSGSTSGSNLASVQQSAGEQTPQQSALATPAPSRTSRGFDKLKRFLSRSPSPSPSPSPCPSPSPGVGRRNEVKSDKPIGTPTPQSLMVPANAAVRPHSTNSGGSTLIARDLSPLTSGNNLTGVSTGNHGSPSSAYPLYHC